MQNMLIISGHPNLEASYTNKIIINEVANAFDRVEIHDLASLYPDSRIDVEKEQAALLKADVVILQFPFYWYSVPGIIKQWIDDVFLYGFAYGSEGNQLKDKKFLLSFTIGAAKESYQPLSFNHFPIEDFLKPLQQTAYLTQMDYQTPVYSHGMVYIPNVYNTQELVEERAHEHATRLIDTLNNITTSK